VRAGWSPKGKGANSPFSFVFVRITSDWMKGNYRKIAYSAVLVGVGVALGYALALVPNVELVSFVCVFSGALLGKFWGGVDGALIFGLYSFLSPFGMPPVPLFATQIICGACMGISGAIAGKKLNNPVYAALTGVLLTLFYDIATNAAGYFTFPTAQTFFVYLLGGITFAVVHILSNGVLFAVLFPVVLPRLTRGWE